MARDSKVMDLTRDEAQLMAYLMDQCRVMNRGCGGCAYNVPCAGAKIKLMAVLGPGTVERGRKHGDNHD